jgi:hypothetical protein
MNNDLRADLVVGNYDKVKVLLNNGDGTFQPVALYPAGFVPNYIAAADFNNDGRPDIFVAGGGNTGALVLNNGDGTLRTPIIYGVGSNPSGVALADFNGDGAVDALVVNKSSNSLTLLLNAMGTTLSLSSSHLPSAFNQSVQITATLRSVAGGAITPTGTVTIHDGGVQLSSQDVSNTGVVGLTTTNFGVGSHGLTAMYSGDTNFIGRNSAPFNQVVNRAPLDVSLQSSQNPVIAGNALSFNAQLTSQFGGQPTGCISFMDGASSLGCQPINSSQASISTSALGFGQRSILADYAGDGNFLPATSPSLPEDVISQIVLSTDSVNFPVNVVGRNSRTASVTVTNRGSAAISISNVASSSSAFSQTNTCGSSLASMQNCTVNVTFSPTSVGTNIGSIQLTDNGAGSPHLISLSGAGIDFSLSMKRPGRNSRSFFSGAPAVAEVTMAVKGELPTAVDLTCIGAPPGMYCSVTPSRIADSNSVTPLKVTLLPRQGSERIAHPYLGTSSVMLVAKTGELVRTLSIELSAPSNAGAVRSRRLSK